MNENKNLASVGADININLPHTTIIFLSVAVIVPIVIYFLMKKI